MRRGPRGLSAYDHFLTMVFAHLTHRESLRDLAACLQSERAYHAGFRSRATRTNIAYANQHRDWRTFAAMAEVLTRRVRRVCQSEPQALELPEMCYALDASMIHLSLEIFPWAYWQTKAAALKMHTLLSLRSHSPAWTTVTEASFPEQKSLDLIPVEAGAFYVMDRGYLDFARLYKLHLASAFFVTRARKRFDFQRLYSQPVERATGVICDQIVTLVNPVPRQGYPEKLRRIRYFDAQKQKRLVFLTNNFNLPPLTIAELYRSRWQVELFFKWIKQHLRIKNFYGTSENALRTQIWIAISVYELVAIVKKELHLPGSLYRMLQICSVTLFEKTPILQALSLTDDQTDLDHLRKQLILFN